MGRLSKTVVNNFRIYLRLFQHFVTLCGFCFKCMKYIKVKWLWFVVSLFRFRVFSRGCLMNRATCLLMVLSHWMRSEPGRELGPEPEQWETTGVGPCSQGVKFLFFPIFLSILLFFLFFSNFLLFFLFFSHFTYNKQIFVRDLNTLSLFKYVVYRVH